MDKIDFKDLENYSKIPFFLKKFNNSVQPFQIFNFHNRDFNLDVIYNCLIGNINLSEIQPIFLSSEKLTLESYFDSIKKEKNDFSNYFKSVTIPSEIIDKKHLSYLESKWFIPKSFIYDFEIQFGRNKIQNEIKKDFLKIQEQIISKNPLYLDLNDSMYLKVIADSKLLNENLDKIVSVSDFDKNILTLDKLIQLNEKNMNPIFINLSNSYKGFNISSLSIHNKYNKNIFNKLLCDEISLNNLYTLFVCDDQNLNTSKIEKITSRDDFNVNSVSKFMSDSIEFYNNNKNSKFGLKVILRSISGDFNLDSYSSDNSRLLYHSLL